MDEKIYLKSEKNTSELRYHDEGNRLYNAFDAFLERTDYSINIYNNLMNMIISPINDFFIDLIESNITYFKPFEFKSLEQLASQYGLIFSSTKLSGAIEHSEITIGIETADTFDAFYMMIPLLNSPCLELALATWVYNDLKNIEFLAPENWKDIVPAFDNEIQIPSGEVSKELTENLINSLKDIIKPDNDIKLIQCKLPYGRQQEYYNRLQVPLKAFLRCEYYLDIITLNQQMISQRNIVKDFTVIQNAISHVKASSQANYENTVLSTILTNYIIGSDKSNLLKFMQMNNLYSKTIFDSFMRVMQKLTTILDGTIDLTKVTFNV